MPTRSRTGRSAPHRPGALTRTTGLAVLVSAAVLGSACLPAAAAVARPDVPGAVSRGVPSLHDAAAVATDREHVWVLSSQNDSVTELSSATGAVVRVVSGSRYGLDEPVGVTSDGTHVWVVNNTGNSVTELSAATGALVRVIKGSRYGLTDPNAISSDGVHVWVTSNNNGAGGGSLTELSAATGALVRIIRGVGYAFDDPTAVTSDGTHVWIANRYGGHIWGVTTFGAVTELSAATGALVRVISDQRDHFELPNAISSDGTRVWVTSSGPASDRTGGSVTVLSASTGALVTVVTGPRYGLHFDVLFAGGEVSSDGTHVWIADASDNASGTGGSVTELSAATGALIGVFAGTRYGFNKPVAVSSDGVHVWVVNNDGDNGAGSITELSAQTGALTAVIH